MTKRKFYKSVISFEVLSEEPLGEVTLERLAEMCDSGPCVGRFGPIRCRTLTQKQAAIALYDFGSQPGFFMLDNEGNQVE